MKNFLKAVIILAKSLNRIAKALESILELYRLKCREEGIEVYKASPNKRDDEIMVSYGVSEPTSPTSPMEQWRNR